MLPISACMTAARPLESEPVTIEEPILTEEESRRGFKAPGTKRMIAGSLVGAVGAYLFHVVGTRRLGETAFAPIGVLWTVFFIVATVVLVPVEQFFTREASRGRAVLKVDRIPALVVIGSTAVATGLFVFATNDRLFNGDRRFILQGVLMVALFGFMQVGKGVLAGHRRFAEYGVVLAGEGMLRLLVAFLALSIAATASSLAWAMVAAPLAALVVLPWRFDRAQDDVERTSATRFLGGYGVGSAASQVLLAGAPLGVTVLGGDAALFSVVFVTFTLFRAPLTLIYNLQGRVLPLLVRMTNEGDQKGISLLARRVLTAGFILSVLAGLVGWVVGPQVVAILFGEGFTPGRVVAACVAAGVLAASTTQVTGQVLVAAGKTRLLATAWLAGLAAAAAALMIVGGGPDTAVAGAFLVGEIVAGAVVALLVLERR
jgi:O-antigen/teichoic acid export membrane protein